MRPEWVFLLTILFEPAGEFGGTVELEIRAKTEQGCLMARSAAVKRLAENLVQHTLEPQEGCAKREKTP